MSRQNIKLAELIFVLPLLLGCQQTLESRVEESGSIVPRNNREKVIFDYFYSLQNQQYSEAYQYRAWHLSQSPLSLEEFAETHGKNHSSLPTKISIGEESKMESGEDEACAYVYTVYTADPGTLQLRSGEVSLHSSPKDPNICLIGYNSAF